MPENDPSDVALLVESVRGAGNIARRFYGGTFKSWDKGHGTPVTEADIAIDEYLKETLLAARPGYGWLSEETADDPARLSRERIFVVVLFVGSFGFLFLCLFFFFVVVVFGVCLFCVGFFGCMDASER